jgi:hypothetical protein
MYYHTGGFLAYAKTNPFAVAAGNNSSFGAGISANKPSFSMPPPLALPLPSPKSPKANPFSSPSPAHNPFMTIVDNNDALWKQMANDKLSAEEIKSTSSFSDSTKSKKSPNYPSVFFGGNAAPPPPAPTAPAGVVSEPKLSTAAIFGSASSSSNIAPIFGSAAANTGTGIFGSSAGFKGYASCTGTIGSAFATGGSSSSSSDPVGGSSESVTPRPSLLFGGGGGGGAGGSNSSKNDKDKEEDDEDNDDAGDGAADGNGSPNGNGNGADDGPSMKIISLPENVKLVTGEEEDVCLLQFRAKLFRLNSSIPPPSVSATAAATSKEAASAGADGAVSVSVSVAEVLNASSALVGAATAAAETDAHPALGVSGDAKTSSVGDKAGGNAGTSSASSASSLFGSTSVATATATAAAGKDQDQAVRAEWIEVGIGPVKLLDSKQKGGDAAAAGGGGRLIMRREDKPGGTGEDACI